MTNKNGKIMRTMGDTTPSPILIRANQCHWSWDFKIKINGRFDNYFGIFYRHYLQFLGGLSLHLNHLIQSRAEISYWLFGTLPIGLLLSNFSQDSLRHLLWHLMTNFEICQLLATPGLFEYLGQKPRCSENQFFLDEGVTRLQQGLGGGVLGGQVPRLYGGTIFGHVRHTWGIQQGIEHKSSVFLTHLWLLRGYSAFTDLVKNQSTGVD